MATNITQRLIAAGASPERARAFEQQFTAQAQKVGIKRTQDIEDAFDAELAAASAVLFPMTFKPPKVSDTNFDAYANLVLGKPAIDFAIKKAAPNYIAALSSPNSYIKDITTAAQKQISLDAVIAEIRKDALTDESLFGGLNEADVIASAKNIYDEYQKSLQVKEDLINSNKYYKAGLPDPKLKYGTKTDFTQGIIDYKTNPGVLKVLGSSKVRQAKQLSQVAPAGYMAGAAKEFGEMKGQYANIEKDIFNQFIKTGATPFKDEVKIRQFLKDKNLK
ncbi:MAG: hypothetical protein EBR82_11900 [Caulobacteraceae bacterium]|nr:hypothetical protein [Caulobacteraceae bacterium]